VSKPPWHPEKRDLSPLAQETIEDLIAVHLEFYKANRAELIKGVGRFVAPKTLEVDLSSGGKRLLTGASSSISGRMRRFRTFPA